MMSFLDTLKKAAAKKRSPEAGPATKPGQPSADSATTTDEKAPESEAVEFAPDLNMLFVGADFKWFSQLEKDLVRLHPNWRCRHVRDETQASTEMGSHRFGALILDSRLPGAEQLLEKIEKLTPHTVRLVLCPGDDAAAIAQWRRPGIHPISAGIDADSFSVHLRRASRLQDWTSDQRIKKLLTLIRKLPAMPKLHLQVSEELRSPHGSLDTVGKIIAQDPVMSAKILQVVNSAYFGLSFGMDDPSQAVLFLGSERTRSLILLAGVFSQFDVAQCGGFDPEKVWNHSLQTAILARTLVQKEIGDPKIGEAAFTAGLLHDVGKLVLAGNVPAMYSAVGKLQSHKNVSLCEAETEILGTTHAELGGCLLGTWSLPLPVLEAVAWHHTPTKSDDRKFSLLTAVHSANVFAHEMAEGEALHPSHRLDLAYLERIGVSERRGHWRELCGGRPWLEEDRQAQLLQRRREAKEN